MSTNIYMLVHNEEKHLSEAIESVLSQDFSDFNFIVSNNGSTDGSIDIINSYLKLDGRVKLIQTPFKMISFDHLKWFLKEISHLNSSYSMMVGGHDVLSRDLLRLLIDRAVLENDNFSILYPESAYEIDGTGKILRKWPSVYDTGVLGSFFDPIMILLSLYYNYPYYGLWNNSVRKKIQPRFNCTGSDHLMVAEASLFGKISSISGGFINFRANSISDDYYRKHFAKDDEVLDENWFVSDFKKQLAWLNEIIMKSTSEYPDVLREACRVSLFNLYLLRYHHHFKVGGIRGLVNIPAVSQLFASNIGSASIIDSLCKLD